MFADAPLHVLRYVEIVTPRNAVPVTPMVVACRCRAVEEDGEAAGGAEPAAGGGNPIGGPGRWHVRGGKRWLSLHY